MAATQRREQLLDAVLSVIAEQGVHKVSIDSVAKRAGVTRPVVYGHFEDTGALLRASLHREEGRAAQQWRDAAAAGAQSTSSEAINNVASSFLNKVRSSPALWRAVLLLADSSTPEFRDRLEAGKSMITRDLEELLHRLNGDTKTSPIPDVPLGARMLLAILWEAARLALSDPHTFTVDRFENFMRQAVTPAFWATEKGC